MGSFNAYEIRQLNLKFEDLSQGHNMLVRVTQQHERDIVQMNKSLRAIVKVIDLVAEYNPGFIILYYGTVLTHIQRFVRGTKTYKRYH
jgi:hypothetical protein